MNLNWVKITRNKPDDEVIKKEYDINNLTYTNNIYKEKFSDYGVTGNIYTIYFNKKVFLGEMEKGKKEGEKALLVMSWKLKIINYTGILIKIQSWKLLKRNIESLFPLMFKNILF